MTNRKLNKIATAALFFLIPVLLVACGDGDAGKGLTGAEVEAVVRAEMEKAPAPSDPGPSSAEVEAMVREAMAGIPTPAPGLTSADVAEAIQAAIAGMPEPAHGLTSADVTEAIQAAIAGMPEPAHGLTSADVTEAIQAAIAGMPTPAPGLTRAEAEKIARSAVALIPSRYTPAEYTRFFVENAVSRYEAQGLEATLAYYNRPGSVDGQWYVFIIDENDLVIAHYEAHRRGLDLKGWVGTDANGYNFGPDMLSATEEGRWVSYVYRNPESGSVGSVDRSAVELKNAWVVRHDGLLFASGWHVNSDEFAKTLVAAAADLFHSVGLEATVAYFRGPDSVAAGLASAIEYYNEAETVDGQWFAFMAEASGKLADHYDPELIGLDLNDLLGADVVQSFQAAGQGVWVTHEGVNPATGQQQSIRAWVVNRGGMMFASGWHNYESGN